MKTGRHVFMLFCCRGSSRRNGAGRIARSSPHPRRTGPGGCAGQYRPDHLCHKMDPNSPAGRRPQSRIRPFQATTMARDSGRGDSTDALGAWKLSTGGPGIPGTLLTGFGDSADATRGYPEDSTDETNS
jgi:hypothetical protein